MAKGGRMDDLRLAALLCTRLCHDLIGPTGAVANGVELLVEDVSGVDEGVVELIQHSAGAATRRLKFFRAALGVAVEGQTLDEARKLAEGYFEGGKIETDWSGAALASGTPLPLGFVPILLNLLLCAAAALPRGGGVGIGAAAAGDGLAIRIEAAGPAIKLSESRLILISTAGGYLRGSQEPFDASNDLGDTSIRLFPSSTPLDALAYAHEHYDHDAADADPQVLLPLRHLDDLVAESVPQVLEAALASGADAALLVPA